MEAQENSQKGFNLKKIPLQAIMNQAKESLKMVETFASQIPALKTGKEATNQKILASLKSLGLVSREELEALEDRVKSLEDELKKLSKTSKAQAKSEA